MAVIKFTTPEKTKEVEYIPIQGVTEDYFVEKESIQRLLNGSFRLQDLLQENYEVEGLILNIIAEWYNNK